MTIGAMVIPKSPDNQASVSVFLAGEFARNPLYEVREAISCCSRHCAVVQKSGISEVPPHARISSISGE